MEHANLEGSNEKGSRFLDGAFLLYVPPAGFDSPARTAVTLPRKLGSAPEPAAVGP